MTVKRDYKALLTLAAALVILFTAVFNPVAALYVAIGSVVVWASYLLVTHYKRRTGKEA